MNSRSVAARVFAVTMLLAGVAHFAAPAFFLGFFGGAPAWVPALPLIYLSGVAELAIGAGLLLPSWSDRAALALLAMMVGYLPLHLIDVFRDHPAVGSATAALVRLPIQLVLIAWAWWIGPLARARR